MILYDLCIHLCQEKLFIVSKCDLLSSGYFDLPRDFKGTKGGDNLSPRGTQWLGLTRCVPNPYQTMGAVPIQSASELTTSEFANGCNSQVNQLNCVFWLDVALSLGLQLDLAISQGDDLGAKLHANLCSRRPTKKTEKWL